MRSAAVYVMAMAIAGSLAAVAQAVFTTAATSPQALRSVADFLPPSASAAQIVGESNTVGVVYSGRSYQVYAAVTDRGNPPAGVKAVKADASAVGGSSAAAVTLTSGSYSAGGVSYNYRSGTLTALGTLGAGTLGYSLTTTDALAQFGTQSFTVTVHGNCAAGKLTAMNGGSSRLRTVDLGDQITYTFTTPIDTTSILSSWTSGTRAVTVVLENAGSGDTVSVRTADNSRTLPLGVINTSTNYAGTGQWLFASVMSYSTANKEVQILLGSRTPTAGSPPTIYTATRMTWTPGSGITDDLGGACSTTALTQPAAVNNF